MSPVRARAAKPEDPGRTEKLYPTPTRLDLLRAVQRGEVEHRVPLLPDPPYDEWRRTVGRGRVVTARVEAFRKAGWITRPRAIRMHDTTTWTLTAEGERVLRQYGGAS